MEPLLSMEEPSMGVAECLVNAGRVISRHGVAFVDDPGAIGEDLAAMVFAKAFSLEVGFAKPQSILERAGEGQVGLIRHSLLPPSPGGTPQYSVIPVTAKHNLRSFLNDDEFGLEARSAVLLLPSEQGRAVLAFDDLNWLYDCNSTPLSLRDGVSWKFGIDISIGKRVQSQTDGVTGEPNSFSLVREDFCFEKGQRIGIAARMKTKPSKFTVRHSSAPPLDLTEEELERVFGKPGNVNIYTGKITLVAENHIEYDINSFTGCSGAVIFLLDKNQPESVMDDDYGKAVAVHAGAHPTLINRNFGFKLRNMLSPHLA